MPTKTELRARLEALLREEGASFGSDALAGELADVIEKQGVLRLDPEAPKLPKRLEVVRLAPEVWQRKGGWLAKVVVPDDLILAVVLDRWSAGPAERRVSLLEEAVAAYNREREEEEMEAEVGAILDEGIPRLLEMELAKEAEKVTTAERARCLAIFDAFLSDLPAGWDFVRLRAKEARGKVESGRSPAVEPAWTGADDLPNPEPAEDWPNPDFPGLKRFTRDPFAESTQVPAGAGSKPFPEWPGRLMVAEDGTLAVAYGSMIGGYGCRRLSTEESREAARRWEAEPRLLGLTLAMSNAMQDDIGAALRALGLPDGARSMSPQQVMQREIVPAISLMRQRIEAALLDYPNSYALRRILTGKES